MNSLTVQVSRNSFIYLRLIYNIQKVSHKYILRSSYGTMTIDPMDAFTMELVQRHRDRVRIPFDVNRFSIRYFMDQENLDQPKDVAKMTTEELDNDFLQLMSKNKDKQITELIKDCLSCKKSINDITLKKLFRNYSVTGKHHMVDLLRKYSSTVNPNMYERNGQFLHYLAKAQCMKGNTDKGLSILTMCYETNEGLRSVYRTMFRELIQDSVLNKSEASLVIFKKYVLEFSDKYGDHYPLVCFWHLCWSSSWFSDQMLSNDLLESSAPLQNIIKDKATAFSISILRQEYNEDAVVRLLQMLLKYKMMAEYVKVLQVLFNYKLKNRDIRGCTEILRNCETLGVSLPSDQQGRYIKMLIEGKHADDKSSKVPPNIFKLKF